MPTTNVPRKRQLSLRLTVVARRMRMQFDESIQGSPITRAHWTLIAVVARNPGTTQKFISQVLQISEAAAGRLIDKLSQEGLLRRESSLTDRRARHVYLTERAEPLLKEITLVAAVNEERSFAGINDSDLDTLERILQAIEANLEADKCTPQI